MKEICKLSKANVVLFFTLLITLCECKIEKHKINTSHNNVTESKNNKTLNDTIKYHFGVSAIQFDGLNIGTKTVIIMDQEYPFNPDSLKANRSLVEQLYNDNDVDWALNIMLYALTHEDASLLAPDMEIKFWREYFKADDKEKMLKYLFE